MSKIYEPQGRAREYSPLAFNFFKGCTHGCAYCYVPRIFGHWNPGYQHSDVSVCIDWQQLEASARKYQGCGKQILLSFTGDPYCGIAPDVTRRVLETLNAYGHKVAILTKGGSRVLQDLDLFRQFGDRIKVGATLTFDNAKDSKEWEPGAALPVQRIQSLRDLRESGIKTWVSFEPVIVPEQTLNLIFEVAPFVHHVKIGKINLYKDYDKTIDWRQFLTDAVNLCREQGVPFYIKEDLRRFKAPELELSPQECDPDYLNL